MKDLILEYFVIQLFGLIQSTPAQSITNNDVFIQFCCPEGQFEIAYMNCTQGKSSWKPDALIEAEARGEGRALYDKKPEKFCPDGKSFSWESNRQERPIEILKNGSVYSPLHSGKRGIS